MAQFEKDFDAIETDICNELIRFHEQLIPKELRAYFRDIQDHVSRLVGLLDGMREVLTTAMQVNLALVANSQNEVVKRLAGWPAGAPSWRYPRSSSACTA